MGLMAKKIICIIKTSNVKAWWWFLLFEFRINHVKELIKELADKFEGWFISFGENTEKYETFWVLIRNEVKIIGKNREELTKLYT